MSAQPDNSSGDGVLWGSLSCILAAAAWLVVILTWGWVLTRPHGTFHDQGGLVITFIVWPLTLGAWLVGGPLALALGGRGMKLPATDKAAINGRNIARAGVFLSRLMLWAGVAGLVLIVIASSLGSTSPSPENSHPGKTQILHGQVIDMAGQPVVDARVGLYLYGREMTMSLWRQTNSGPDGAFYLEAPHGLGLLVASKPGLAHCWKGWGDFRSKPPVLVLTRPATVSGTVVDEAGQGVSNALVWVRSAVIQHARPNSFSEFAQFYGAPVCEMFSARSGADGKFSIGQLPLEAGLGLVAQLGNKVSDETNRIYTLNQMPYYAGQRDIQLIVAGPESLGAVLSRSRPKTKYFSREIMTIRGTVRDVSGEAVGGVKVMSAPRLAVSSTNREIVETRSDGTYEFTFLVDSLRDNIARNCKPLLLARDSVYNRAATAEISEGVTNLDLVLHPGFEVSGQVMDTSGKILPQAYVMLGLYNAKWMSYFDETYIRMNAEGRFQVRGLPLDRKYSIRAGAPRHGAASLELAGSDSVSNHLELRPLVLKVADRQLRGVLLDEAGRPQSATFVSMYGDGQSSASARTDAEGRFSFAEVCEGLISLSANSQGLSAFAQVAGGETNVILRLRKRSETPTRIDVIPKRSEPGR